MKREVIVVMGVAGSGKSTIATLLARRLSWDEADADYFHPEFNVEKMRLGIPLTDADREPWLDSIRDWLDRQPGSVIVTCSALRRSYRDVLRRTDARTRFIHLDGSEELLASRLRRRAGHFMPASLLRSQLDTIECLQPDEEGIVVDVGLTPHTLVSRIISSLQLVTVQPPAASDDLGTIEHQGPSRSAGRSGARREKS